MDQGIIIKNTGSWYTVKNKSGEFIQCRIKGKFRMQGIRSTNPLAVGDNVEYGLESDNTGIIQKIIPRKNIIVRKASNLSKKTQIMAANVDQAVLVATVDFPHTSTVFIDRFLSAAESYGIPAVLVFNKLDRYGEVEKDTLAEWLATYNEIGYLCIFTSAKNGTNLDAFKALLKDKVSILAGHSGVGKSTLINSVAPGLSLKTSEISEAHQTGKHTTTFSEMHPLPFGGYIIDTPGIRGFGTIDLEKEEIYHFFPEIFAEAKKCKFHNCLHTHEPGCSVKEAVDSGEIAHSRYKSYISILEDPEDTKYRGNSF